MQSNDVQDALQEGWEVGPLPPPGPDGSLNLPPMRPQLEPPPLLCAAGPCRHYHRFEIQLDGAPPMGARLAPGGGVVGQAPTSPFHVEVHHYCYPEVGIETRLGALPVLQCNRWLPVSASDRANDDKAREIFLATTEGRAYRHNHEPWRAERQAAELEDAQAEAEAEREIAAAEAARAQANASTTPSEPDQGAP